MNDDFPIENQPYFDPNSFGDPMGNPDRNQEEEERKQLSYKRMSILLLSICVILAVFIAWEIIDIIIVVGGAR